MIIIGDACTCSSTYTDMTEVAQIDRVYILVDPNFKVTIIIIELDKARINISNGGYGGDPKRKKEEKEETDQQQWQAIKRVNNLSMQIRCTYVRMCDRMCGY